MELNRSMGASNGIAGILAHSTIELSGDLPSPLMWVMAVVGLMDRILKEVGNGLGLSLGKSNGRLPVR